MYNDRWIYEGALARMERANFRLCIMAAIFTTAIIGLSVALIKVKEGGTYEK